MDIRPLEGVGAEITGVDLKALSRAEETAIRDAFAEQGVIFFRDQSLSEEDHIAFAQRFGQINVNRFFAAHPDYPQIAMVAKDVGDTDNIGGGWHTDHSYDEIPALGSVLVARELPKTGGDTRFASMYRAYETLPDELKRAVEGKRAIHSARHIFGGQDDSYYSQSDAGRGRIGNADAVETLSDVAHPLIITHPLSGKKALFVNPAFTIGIDGMDEAGGKALLQKLFAHAMREEHTCRFKWEPGSVAFWDNRSTWHWALNDYQGQRRVMHRITIEGVSR
ncbi:MAG: taurine dioxygenase [Henriciella sp.]|jgi:taurine dioxygenase|uniref:TauD/TfdA dioxygenase family protein n=1 Tax=uncultured Henriciella sp. TaxID=1608424 RepID=UPI000C6652C9|nr:TauD/TfdA family dioxygenase [Henriciella sp.]MAN75432.1 taurine dioxygenase [Henriciella sp.]MBF34923.1 taurine dioxygenase [Hyphomonadaceae bacterium]MBK76776.1 taurine dioxygenase [Henriciella sp.]